MWELYYKESWAPKNWCFWTVVLEKTLESPWTARISNQSILKEISSEYSLEELMLKLKLQYFGHLMERTDLFEDPDTGKEWRQEEKGLREEEMIGWHQQLHGHDFEWTPGVGDGQGGPVCCSPWGLKEWDTAERLNWTKLQSLDLTDQFLKLSPVHHPGRSLPSRSYLTLRSSFSVSRQLLFL